MKQECIEAEGYVLEQLGGGNYKVELMNNHEIICYLNGKLKKNMIKIIPGDKVKVELSPYDLTKGRITFRFKNVEFKNEEND